MSTASPAPKRKKLLLVGTIGIVIVAVGGGLIYLQVRDRPFSNPPKPSTSSPGPPQNVITQFEDSVPSGTISPSEITKDPNKFSGKEVKVRGIIVQMTDGKYFVVGQEKTNPPAIALDLTNSGSKIDDYVSAYADPNKTTPQENGSNTPKNIGPVTVTATFSAGPTTASLKVKKIEAK
jgi:hypothetical protein